MRDDSRSWMAIVRNHWPEYLMEAWGLGTFMVSAGCFATLLEYPLSPVHEWIPDGTVRRGLIGLAMGITAIGIIYSPWGKQSGAHLNPAVTLTFLRLGKIRPIDALFYIIAQFIGGTIGVLLVWIVLGAMFSDPPIFFVNTIPGASGDGIAFVVEFFMSFGLMAMVLSMLSFSSAMPLIGVCAGVLVATYITLFAPLSGMSINPARTLASAIPVKLWDYLWIYFTAPIAGMLLAVEIHRLVGLGHRWFCAKLNHDYHYRCIHCGYEPHLGTATDVESTAVADPRGSA